jgi:uncharacterized membrane protein YqgA involved in biofilm formation
MMGTILNIITVLVGGGLGLAFGNRLPDRVRQTLLSALGLFTAAVGVRLFLQTSNLLIPLAALVLGGLAGEWWRIEEGLRGIGARLERRFAGGEERGGTGGRFVRGFLTASLVFCIGPMTILGSVQDGLTGDYSLLAIKAALDGVAAMAFASALGAGVLFSTLTIAVYQGGLTLLAAQAQAALTQPMIAEMSAVGGVILIGVAMGNLLELKPIRTASLLPALAIAPAIAWIVQNLGGR